MAVDIREGFFVTPNVRLTRPLGSGGMGAVWVAVHEGIGNEVAVKFLDRELAKDPVVAQRFWREAKAASQVKSAHVVQVHDFGVLEQEQPFIVMELLEGQDLGARIRERGALPPADVVLLMSQLARALGKAHEKGITHRDLKPENIFLCNEGRAGEMFVKVLDFGIAKAGKELDRISRSTRPGTMLGTPYYMSPEQLRGDASLDSRADIWALGVVAYEALTGALPFNGDNIGALAMAIVAGKPTPLSTLAPGLSPAIDAWFAKACAQDPEHRFANVHDLAVELAVALGQAPSQRDVSVASQLPRASPSVPAVGRPERIGTLAGDTIPAGVPPRRGLVFGAFAAFGVLAIAAVLVLALTRTKKPTATLALDPPPTAEIKPLPSAEASASAAATSSAVLPAVVAPSSTVAPSATTLPPSPAPRPHPAPQPSGPKRPKDIF